MAESKNDQNTPGSNQNKGSGSDTVSAAKISAGTSVGTVGQSPPMPHQQGGTQSGAGNPAQSSTLASHTSTPLGGQSGGHDQQSGSSPGQGGQSGTRNQQHASPSGSQSQGSQGQGSQGQGQSSKAATETVRQTAEQARERAGEVYEDASEWVRDTYESATSWASDAMGRGRSGGGRGRAVGGAR